MKDTAISWADHTFNGWEGCTKASPKGCRNCYAEARDIRFAGGAHWGPGAPRRRTSDANWRQPVAWNAVLWLECLSCRWRGDERAATRGMFCPQCGVDGLIEARARVFSLSLGDWLDNEVPDEWRLDMLALVRATPRLDWLLLTKRIGAMQQRLTDALAIAAVSWGRERWPGLAEWLADWLERRPPANVWLGATMVDQTELERDHPKLIGAPAVRHFISAAPLLDRLDFGGLWWTCCGNYQRGTESDGRPGQDVCCGQPDANDRPDLVIVEGESGTKARPTALEHVRAVRDQCAAAGVTFHLKQWGEWVPEDQRTAGASVMPANPPATVRFYRWTDGSRSIREGVKDSGRALDGELHLGMPA